MVSAVQAAMATADLPAPVRVAQTAVMAAWVETRGLGAAMRGAVITALAEMQALAVLADPA